MDKLCFSFLITLFIFSPLAKTQESEFGQRFFATWDRAMAYTLEVAEAMPDSLYGYQPTEEVFTFREHLLHLEANMYSLGGRFVTGEPIEVTPAPSDLPKAETIQRITAAMGYVDSLLRTLSDEELQEVAVGFWAPEPQSKAQIILLIRDHMTHHRAQMVLYLRMVGITPPRFRGW